MDLYCDHCDENLGKNTELPVNAGCGTCGKVTFNSQGYVENEEHYEELKKLFPKKKIPKP